MRSSSVFLGLLVLLIPGLLGASWVEGETSMTRLSEAQRRAYHGPPHDMAAIVDMARRHPASIIPLSDEQFPAAFSWRDINGQDWMSPVRDQGSCGSCWSFGALAAMEGHINITVDDPSFDMDLSEQFMVSCGAGSCESGGFAEEVLAYLRTTGIPDEACFPYIAQEGSCADACADWRDRVVKIYDWNVLLAPTQQQLKTELLKGPMPVTMRVDSGFYGYRSGVFIGDFAICNMDNPTDHVVTLVGWDDAEDSWIVKNSWGDDWGDGGYFRIRRGTSCLGTFSANWLRVDPTTIPGVELDIGVCGPQPPLLVEVYQGFQAQTPTRFDLSNCGETYVPWSVRRDAITHLAWLEVDPFEGALDEGEQVVVEIWPDGRDKPLGDHNLVLNFTPKISGRGYALNLTIRVVALPDEPDGDTPLDGDEPDGDAPLDGDEPDGDAPLDGDEPDGDAPLDGDEPDGDTPLDGDEPDGDAPLDGDEADGDTPLDGDEADGDGAPVGGGGSSTCHSSPVSVPALSALWLLLLALWRRGRLGVL